MCVCVKVGVCVHLNRLKEAWQWDWPITNRCITLKWIHRLVQDLFESLVMSQRAAD